MKPKFIIILFYKYIPITDPESLKQEQRSLLEKLNLKGRFIVATEGINGTLEGTPENIEEYIKQLKSDPRFKDIHIKQSEGVGNAFPKLSVKVRSEIVAYRLGENDIKPWITTGEYITPEELHQWFNEKRKFYIVDMRNGFEQTVGHFKNSVFTDWENSDDLPSILKELKHIPSDEPIVTVCTGGVRCEKASGFLIKHGFKNVYQLHGGIHSYIEKYPNQEFKGALYTFDSRLVMGFNMDDPEREIVGECSKCKSKTEKFINCKNDFCNRQFLICESCLECNEKILCPMGCRDYSKEHPEAFR